MNFEPTEDHAMLVERLARFPDEESSRAAAAEQTKEG